MLISQISPIFCLGWNYSLNVPSEKYFATRHTYKFHVGRWLFFFVAAGPGVQFKMGNIEDPRRSSKKKHYLFNAKHWIFYFVPRMKRPTFVVFWNIFSHFSPSWWFIIKSFVKQKGQVYIIRIIVVRSYKFVYCTEIFLFGLSEYWILATNFVKQYGNCAAESFPL